MIKHLSSALLACMLCACSVPPPHPDAQASASTARAGLHEALTAQGAWRLQDAVDARGERMEVLLAKPIDYRLQFNDDRVSVIGGCNQMGGTVRISGDTLRIDDLVSTMMACEEPLMRAEDAMAHILRQPARLTLQDGTPQLRWVSESGESLYFSAMPLE